MFKYKHIICLLVGFNILTAAHVDRDWVKTANEEAISIWNFHKSFDPSRAWATAPGGWLEFECRRFPIRTMYNLHTIMACEAEIKDAQTKQDIRKIRLEVAEDAVIRFKDVNSMSVGTSGNNKLVELKETRDKAVTRALAFAQIVSNL